VESSENELPAVLRRLESAQIKACVTARSEKGGRMKIAVLGTGKVGTTIALPGITGGWLPEGAFLIAFIPQLTLSSANLDSTSGDLWMDSLAKKYLQYWDRALMNTVARADAENELRAELSNFLGRAIQNDEELDKSNRFH
jgi:hypothetical protein